MISNALDGASRWPSRDHWGGRWYVTNACGCPTYVRISELSPLLDDHGVFQSMRVVKRIQLGLFDVPKGPGVVGRAHPRRRRYLF